MAVRTTALKRHPPRQGWRLIRGHLKREIRRAGSRIVRRETRRGDSLFQAASSRYDGGMAGSTEGVGEADAYLAAMGYSTGVRGAVRRFRERAVALQELALRWQTAPPQAGAPGGESASHPGGIFYLETLGTSSARLIHVWPGWGRRTIGSGHAPERLRSDALGLLRKGGPFGGPTLARAGERIVQVHEPQGGMRSPLPDGSEIRVLLLEPHQLSLRIWPEAKFAQTPTGSQNDPAKLIDDDAEYLSFGSTRILWAFTDVNPLVGAMRADPYDLLLCPLRTNRVALIATEGNDILGIKIGSWDEIRGMDAGSWIGSLEPRKPPTAKAADATSTQPKSETPKSAKSAKKTKGKPGTAEAAAGGDPAGETPKRRRRVATSPGSMPGPRERRVRIKPALAAAITQHLASVAAALPAGELGAAFAVELLRALEAAVLANLPTLSGKTIELFSRLHKKGLLPSIPADQAGRAALKLLAERTPLVRRLHYRRWCFAFGDIHEPTSGLRARLGPLSDE